MLSTSFLINFIVICLFCWLVYAFLIPILPPPINTIAYVVLVIVVIVWLLRLVAPGLLLSALPVEGWTTLYALESINFIV